MQEILKEVAGWLVFILKLPFIFIVLLISAVNYFIDRSFNEKFGGL
jgi:hypothetical protein